MPESAVINKRISQCPATAADAALIEEIYFYTRNEEFSSLGWTEEQVKIFLKMQCEFQQKSYQLQFQKAESSIIFNNEQKIGRLIIERTENEIKLVDIALLPQFRNAGIGSKLIGDLIEEAKQCDKTITLQVAKSNTAALRLYLKFGFEITDENDLYISMKKNSREK